MKSRFILISLCIFLSLFGLVLLSYKVLANPPSNMELVYDESTTTLNVTITHVVSNPSTHFIETVTIKVNDTTQESAIYTSQPDSSTFLYQYTNINATSGNVISVTAVCNISGQIEKSLTVGGSNKSIPGFAYVGIISFLMISLLIGVIHTKIRRMN